MKILSKEYTKAAYAKDEPALKAAEDKLDILDAEIKGVFGQYAKKHPESPIAVFAITRYAGWDINVV